MKLPGTSVVKGQLEENAIVSCGNLNLACGWEWFRPGRVLCRMCCAWLCDVGCLTMPGFDFTSSAFVVHDLLISWHEHDVVYVKRWAFSLAFTRRFQWRIVRVRDDLSLSLPTQAMPVLCYAQFSCVVFCTHVLVDISAAFVVGCIHRDGSVTEVGEAIKNGLGNKAWASPRDTTPCGVCGKETDENVGQVEGVVAISLARSFCKEKYANVSPSVAIMGWRVSRAL